MLQLDASNNEVFESIQDAITKITNAREFSQPYIKAAEAAEKTNKLVHQLTLDSKKAYAISVRPQFDLGTKHGSTEALRDCLNRSKEDCTHRSRHCAWLNDIRGCSIKCNAVEESNSCNDVGEGGTCVWGVHNGKQICYHK